jgi:hypothetical protein
MILRLKTNAYAPEMTSILDLVVELMAHLATCPSPGLDEERFTAEMPRADWLLKHLHVHIDELLLHTTQVERKLLEQAVRNDRQFDVNVDSQSFRFQYPGLPAHVRKRSKLLLAAFYDTLLKNGFLVTRNDGTTLVVDRRLLEQGFFERNKGIRACPACMEVEISLAPDDAATTTDCDHYLPKTLYGPLAIHPQNLVFICMLCNQRRKGQHDPLVGSGSSHIQIEQRTEAGLLRRRYLPYRRSAWSELRIKFAREGVTLTADTDLARERVANLDRVFELASVWSDVLPRAEREMFEELDGPPTKNSVKAVLDNTESRGQGVPEQLKQGAFLRGQYAAHLRKNHLDVLTKEWQRKSEERRKSTALYAG